MDSTQDQTADRPTEPSVVRRRLPSLVLAGGAALGMTLAGLGIANAETGSAVSPTPAAPWLAGDGVKLAPIQRSGGPGCVGFGADLASAASAIGITEAELHSGLASGRSIADLAKASGVDVQKVVDAMAAGAKADLAERVSAGELTQADADEKLANLADKLTVMVSSSPRFVPERGFMSEQTSI